jgi:hypothetical protein
MRIYSFPGFSLRQIAFHEAIEVQTSVLLLTLDRQDGDPEVLRNLFGPANGYGSPLLFPVRDPGIEQKPCGRQSMASLPPQVAESLRN